MKSVNRYFHFVCQFTPQWEGGVVPHSVPDWGGWYPILPNGGGTSILLDDGTPSFLMGYTLVVCQSIFPNGGYPIFFDGGTPSFLMQEYLILPNGGYWGTPLSGLDGGTPVGSGRGYPPSGLDGGNPCWDWMVVPAPLPSLETEQLCGGRYASCIHEGGLSYNLKT